MSRESEAAKKLMDSIQKRKKEISADDAKSNERTPVSKDRGMGHNPLESFIND